MTINDVKTNSLLCYSIIIYILLLTGAGFYMNYKINVIQDVQFRSIRLFRTYAERDSRQQEEIGDINKKVDELQKDLGELDTKVNTKLTDIIYMLGNGKSTN